VAGFLDALGLEQAHLLGLSWGAILAQEFYRGHGDRIRSLVLAGAYAGWRGSLPEPVWRERLATCLADADGPPDALVAKLLPGMFTAAAPAKLRAEFTTMASDFHPLGFRLMSLSSAEVDTTDLLPWIDVPTLLVWGEQDRRSPLPVAAQFHATIPGAELAILPDAGHVCNLEQPALFNAKVRDFCRRT
jgi:pimeloyl-ACP methyl ester carboxylesterase